MMMIIIFNEYLLHIFYILYKNNKSYNNYNIISTEAEVQDMIDHVVQEEKDQ